MKLTKFYRLPTIVNAQQRYYRRREPYLPYLADRHVVKRQNLLDKFEKAQANGEVFIPDARLPPWKKRQNPELDRAGRGNSGVNVEKVNFLGFKVRLAKPAASPPGFPTHWQ